MSNKLDSNNVLTSYKLRVVTTNGEVFEIDTKYFSGDVIDSYVNSPFKNGFLTSNNISIATEDILSIKVIKTNKREV